MRETKPNQSRTSKLKVFQTQFGFYDTVVAAPSQAAALRAWGVHQDLFASGNAKMAEDSDAISAATKFPQQPLRRAIGSGAPFVLEPTSLPTLPDNKKGEKVRGEKKDKPAQRPPADRAALDAAEAALNDLDSKREDEKAEFKRRLDNLTSLQSAAQDSFSQARARATRVVAAARLSYRKAGGRE